MSSKSFVGVGTMVLVLLMFICVGAWAEKITIEYRDLFTGPDDQAMASMVEEFNKTHPNIKVERSFVKWERYYDQLQLAIAGGNPPDVVVIHARWLPAFAARGALIPIESYITKFGIQSKDFLERPWNATFYKGHQYAVPLDVIVSVVTYYNKDLMVKAGIEVPPSNKEEYISFSSKIQQATGKWGTLVPLTGYITYRNYFTTLHQNNVSVVTPDHKKANFNNPAGVEALQFWVDLIYKHKIAPSKLANAGDAFKLGEAGFYLDGIWMDMGFSRQEGFNYGVTIVPKFFKNRSSFGNSHVFVVPKGRKKLTDEKISAIITFVKWMSENTYTWSQVPAVKSVLNSDQVQQSVRGKVIAQLPYIVYPPALVKIGRVEKAVQEAVEAALAGKADVEDVLKKAADEVNAVLG